MITFKDTTTDAITGEIVVTPTIVAEVTVTVAENAGIKPVAAVKVPVGDTTTLPISIEAQPGYKITQIKVADGASVDVTVNAAGVSTALGTEGVLTISQITVVAGKNITVTVTTVKVYDVSVNDAYKITKIGANALGTPASTAVDAVEETNTVGDTAVTITKVGTAVLPTVKDQVSVTVNGEPVDPANITVGAGDNDDHKVITISSKVTGDIVITITVVTYEVKAPTGFTPSVTSVVENKANATETVITFTAGADVEVPEAADVEVMIGEEKLTSGVVFATVPASPTEQDPATGFKLTITHAVTGNIVVTIKAPAVAP